ncbi:hypothetical protein AB6A40_010075, partial [Gnathostoma spinigerum]
PREAPVGGRLLPEGKFFHLWSYSPPRYLYLISVDCVMRCKHLKDGAILGE